MKTSSKLMVLLKIVLVVVAVYASISLLYTQLYRYSTIRYRDTHWSNYGVLTMTQLPVDLFGNALLTRGFSYSEYQKPVASDHLSEVTFGAGMSVNSESELAKPFIRSREAAVFQPSQNGSQPLWRLGYCFTSNLKQKCYLSSVLTSGSQAALKRTDGIQDWFFGVNEMGDIIPLTFDGFYPILKLGSIPLV